MKQTFQLLLFCVAALSLTACEKCIIEESSVADDEPSKLFISTRAAAANDGGDADGEISYPVNVYVFDEDGACVATKSIESSEEPLELNVPAGDYDVYAMAGADGEDYNLPSKSDAATNATVELKEGHAHGDLMTANGSVTMAFGEENKLTLELARKVMMLESINIEKVPENVTAVSVTLSPLRENLLLNGDYEGSNGVFETDLQKASDGTTWKSSKGVYLLEAAGPATVKVSFTTKKEEDDEKVQTYSFECSDELKANHKININGTFGEGNLKMEGIMTGAAWDSPVDIPLDFSDGESSTTTSDDDTTNEGTGEIPSVGTLYKGCYVLKSESAGSKMLVTLMAPGQNTTWSFDKNNQASIKKEMDEALLELAIDGISGWRLPTFDEMEYMRKNLDCIIKSIETINTPKKIIKPIINNQMFSYFYKTEDGDIKSYILCDKDLETYIREPASGTSFYLRAFATVSFNN